MFVIEDFAKLHHASHIIWDIDGTITDENGQLSPEVAAKIICLGSGDMGIHHTFITGRDGNWLIEKIVAPMQKFPMFRDVSHNLTFYGEAGSVVVGIGSGKTVTKKVHQQVEDHPLALNKRGIRDNLRELVYDPTKLTTYEGEVGAREKVIYDGNEQGWIVNIDEDEPPLHPYIWSTSKEVFATLEKIRDEEGKIKDFDQAPFVQIVKEMIKKKGFERQIDIAPAATAIDIVPKAKGLKLGKSWAAGRALLRIHDDVLGCDPNKPDLHRLRTVIDDTIAFGDSEADLDFITPLFPQTIQRKLSRDHRTLQIVFVGDDGGIPGYKDKYKEHIIIHGTGEGDLAFNRHKNVIQLHAARGARVVSAVLDFLKQWDYFKPFIP